MIYNSQRKLLWTLAKWVISLLDLSQFNWTQLQEHRHCLPWGPKWLPAAYRTSHNFTVPCGLKGREWWRQPFVTTSHAESSLIFNHTLSFSLHTDSSVVLSFHFSLTFSLSQAFSPSSPCPLRLSLMRVLNKWHYIDLDYVAYNLTLEPITKDFRGWKAYKKLLY